MAKNQNELSSELLNYHPQTIESISWKMHAATFGRALITTISLISIDLISMSMAFITGILMRLYLLPLFNARFNNNIPATFWSHIWWIIAIWILCLFYEGLYIRKISFWRESQKVVQATVAAFLLAMTIIFLTKLGSEFSRTTLVLIFTLALILLPLGRYLGKNLLARIGLWNEPVLILGTGKTGMMIARALKDEPYIGYKVYGFLEDETPQKRKKRVMVDGVAYCILGGFNDAIKVITDNNIRNIILALPSKPGPELVGLTNKLKAYTHSILVVPDLIGISVTDSQITHFSNDQIVAYSTCNNLANPVNLLIKNLFDRIMGIIIFVIILPLLAFLTLIVKLDSPGPAIYSGNRIGRLGKEFRCYKFRTMYLNNDEILKDYFSKNPWEMDDWYKYAKLRGDDPRVTRVGKWLRKLSLDELPQIFNVLGGEMSLVGARPYLPREKGQMGKDADTILIAKPGITGLWQVSGRNEIDFRGRIDLETWYVRNWSMWFDITLLIRTVGVVLGRKGAY